jgi:hypothetical protein
VKKLQAADQRGQTLMKAGFLSALIRVHLRLKLIVSELQTVGTYAPADVPIPGRP